MNTNSLLKLIQSQIGGYRSPGDEIIRQNDLILLPAYNKLGVIVNKDETEATIHNNNKSMFCNEPNCNSYFNTVAEYQSHFNSSHRFICFECKRSLPTAHLLDLHLAEQHDSYFAAKLARGIEPMFACYLDTCTEKFMTVEARKEHCITVHKFPANYRFYQTRTTKNHKGKKTQETELIEEQPVKQLEYVKAFCFGYHCEKAFNIRKNQQKSNKTLENMEDLKNALSELME